MTTTPESRARTLATSLALFGAAVVLLACDLPERLYGDDSFLVRCIVRDRPFPPHLLYLPLARAAARAGLVLGCDPFTSLRLLSVVGVAGATAFVYAAARRTGLATATALGVSLLFLAAPSTQFFGVTAEVHGLHALGVGVLAFALTRLSARCSGLDVLWVVLALAFAIGTHKSGLLLVPGVVAAVILTTRGRATHARVRDLRFVAVGVAVAFLVGAAIRALEGAPDGDSPQRYLDGLLAQLTAGFGLEELIRFTSTAWVATAFAPTIVGAFAVGALLRSGKRVALALTAFLVPYLVFFPLFGWPERGAYHLVTLPVLVAALAWLAQPERDTPPARRALPRALVLVAALGATLRPDELLALLGDLGPAQAAGVALALGIAWPAAPFGRRGTAVALLSLAALQLVGSRRDLAEFDSTRPLLDAARAASEESVAYDGGVWITASFQERWLLNHVCSPWPEPWAGSWPFTANLPARAPQPFELGHPSATAATLPDLVEQQLAAGKLVFVADNCTLHVLEHPTHAPWLEGLEARFDLVPSGRDDLPARIVRRR